MVLPLFSLVPGACSAIPHPSACATQSGGGEGAQMAQGKQQHTQSGQGELLGSRALRKAEQSGKGRCAPGKGQGWSPAHRTPF